MDNNTHSAAAAPAFHNFTVAHELRRRVRVVAPSLRKDLERAYATEILLRKHKGIRNVRSVADLGSVAIDFDPAGVRTLLVRAMCQRRQIMSPGGWVSMR